MKLENQICTLEQGVKLKELGVLQLATFWTPVIPNRKEIRCRIESDTIGMELDHAVIIDGEPSVNYNCISRFTVAELGAMLPASVYKVKKCKNEAEARADLLIQMLSKGLTKVEDVNQRLRHE
jgi:hypothetical protein